MTTKKYLAKVFYGQEARLYGSSADIAIRQAQKEIIGAMTEEEIINMNSISEELDPRIIARAVEIYDAM